MLMVTILDFGISVHESVWETQTIRVFLLNTYLLEALPSWTCTQSIQMARSDIIFALDYILAPDVRPCFVNTLLVHYHSRFEIKPVKSIHEKISVPVKSWSVCIHTQIVSVSSSCLFVGNTLYVNRSHLGCFPQGSLDVIAVSEGTLDNFAENIPVGRRRSRPVCSILLL